MSSVQTEVKASDPSGKVYHELMHLKDHWWWFMLLGVALLIAGIVAIAYPFFSSQFAVIILGALLLGSGIAMIISSFWTGKWSAFLVQLLIGIMYVVVGLLTIDSPVEATAAITLVIAALFIIAGIFRMIAAITIRFPQWGWVMLNGAVSLMVGVMIYRQYPISALWVIGLLFGLDMMFNGWSWIMVALELRNFDVSQESAATS